MSKYHGCLALILTAILAFFYCIFPIVTGMMMTEMLMPGQMSFLAAVVLLCGLTALVIFFLHKIWNYEFKNTAKFLSITAVITAVITFLFRSAYVLGTNNRIWSLAGAVLGITAIIITIGAIIMRFSKKKLILYICLGISAVTVILMICAVNDFPYALRHLSGEDFFNAYVGILITCHILSCIGCMIINRIITVMPLGCDYSRLTDKEIIGICDNNTYKYKGYYLLKAKLSNILLLERYDHRTGTVYSESRVSLRPDLSSETLNKLSCSDPDLAAVISFLNKNTEPVSLSYLLKNVKTVKPLSETNEATLIRAHLKKCSTTTYIIYFCAVFLASVPGILKLMMGVYNNKPSSNLGTFLFVGQAIFVLGAALLLRFFIGRSKAKVKKNILKVLSTESGHIPNVINMVGYYPEGLSQADIRRILRSYCIHPSTPNSDKALTVNDSLCTEIFKTAAILTLADRASSSDGGCSSCSSCSSCGGCGGGCGGCGD